MSTPRRAAPPSGMPPPVDVTALSGETIQLVPLAEEVTERHLERHPEDVARYGRELAWQWSVHDMQHVLAWAIADQAFQEQLQWLARVLGARDYPVENLIDCTLTAADVVQARLPGTTGGAVAERMRAAARALPSGETRTS